jgi:putative transposase
MSYSLGGLNHLADQEKRYTEDQIIGFLREADAGLPVKELCRKHGFSEPSYYAWKAKFGGMKVSDAQRLKALEAENTKLKIMRPAIPS